MTWAGRTEWEEWEDTWGRFTKALDERLEELMATLQDVVDSVAGDKAAVEEAAARVAADLSALSAQVQTLSDQIAAGGAVTAADLGAVKDSIDAVTGEAAAIDPAAPPVA